MNETVEETIEYVATDANNNCIIRNFCINQLNSPIHIKCYALLHLTSLYEDPLLNRKTVQTFACSTNSFLLQLLDGLKTSVLAVLPNITEDEMYELEKVWSNEKGVFNDMLTEHTRFALLKKINAYIEPVDKIIGHLAGRNNQGLQEQKPHKGIILVIYRLLKMFTMLGV